MDVGYQPNKQYVKTLYHNSIVILLEWGRGVFESAPQYLGIGRHLVTWEHDPCEGRKESEILVTLCSDEEFTCR